MSVIVVNPFSYFSDTNGKPLDNGSVYIGEANKDPESYPVQVYWDEGLSIPATQPLDTVSGYIVRSGTQSQAFAASDYSMRVRNKNGEEVFYQPEVRGDPDVDVLADLADTSNDNKNSALVGFKQVGFGAVDRTVQSKLREDISVKDYGALGDGTNNDTAAIQAAIDYAESIVATYGAVTVKVPSGKYRTTATITVQADNVSLVGDSAGATTIVADGDYGDTIVFGRADRFAAFENFQRGNWVRDINFTTTGDTTSGAHIVFSRCLRFGAANVTGLEKFGGLIVEGGAWGWINNVDFSTGSYFPSARAGSFCMLFRAAAYTGGRDRPSTVFVSNFESHAYFSNRRVDYGILIQACDGLWFSNGHTGFTKTACFALNPTNPADPVISVMASNVYCDGTGSADGTAGSDYGLLIQDGGAHTGYFGKHIFTGCHFGLNHEGGAGIYLNSAVARDISFVGGSASDNYGAGVWVSKGRDITFSGFNVCRNNQGNNSAGNMRIFGNASKISVSGGINAGDPASATDPVYGISVEGTVNDLTIKGVQFSEINGPDIVNSSSGTRLDIDDNQTDEAATVASAAALQLPVIGDVFNVSGTNNITSIAATSSLRGRRVTLIFSGALTVVNGNNLVLVGGNVTTSVASTLTLVCDGANWYRAGSTP